MDPRLHERLERWHSQIDTLSEAERICLGIEACEKPLWSRLYLASDGKNVADREARAYVHPEWEKFNVGMVEARVAYNRERRELELQQAAFNAAYLQSKHESDAIQRYPKTVT